MTGRYDDGGSFEYLIGTNLQDNMVGRPPPMPAVHSSRRQNDEPSLYVEIPAEPPQPTIASLAAARSVTPDTLLRTAALGLHHSPMMAPHLKFGMLVSFALATVFLAGAKYYFDRQVSLLVVNLKSCFKHKYLIINEYLAVLICYRYIIYFNSQSCYIFIL